MANKKFDAQNIWANVCNFLSIAWTWTKNICGGIIFFIVTFLRVIFVYNPVMFPIWVLLGYRKSPAEVMFGEKKSFWDELWDAAPQAFCRWQVYCFPWFMKRDFVKQYPTCFALKEQVKLAMELPENEKYSFIPKMEEEAVELLWRRDDYACNMAIIKKRKTKMDAAMIKFLLEKKEIDIIKCFLSQNAPSSGCIEEMVDATKFAYKRDEAVECLRYTVLKHGLSAALIEKVYEKLDKDDISTIEEVLIQRNQWLMINKLKECNPENQFLWEQFCLKNEKIWSAAQKLMCYWMLDMFYASGHKLSEDALVYFLSAENPHREDIAKIIFANEEDLDAKALAVIRSIPDVYTIYMQTR